jgi:glycosyltransferase involved in cell wall biosynthesis
MAGRARHSLQLRNALDLSKLRPRKMFSGAHVAVAGLFRTTTGLGRAAELVARSLERKGHRVVRVDISEALGARHLMSRVDCMRPDDCKSLGISDVVLVVNPDHPATLAFDSSWLAERCVIGHWIWEIEVLPWYWAVAVKSFDEIWAPTGLVRDVIAVCVHDRNVPVKVMPYAIDLDPMPIVTPAHRAAVRSRLGIADGTFVAGYSFAVDSNYYRKNPEDAVRVFTRAFPRDDESVGLLLRSSDFSNRPAERAGLQALIAGDPRIRILDTADPIGIVDFYAALDVYLSTSRAEGYGLNLVEASQAGVAVITGGWRIAPEITTLPGVRTTPFRVVPVQDPQGHYARLRGAAWSAPDIAEMADLLRQDRARFDACRAGARAMPVSS